MLDAFFIGLHLSSGCSSYVSLCPAMHHGKSCLMEASNPIGSSSKDATQPLLFPWFCPDRCTSSSFSCQPPKLAMFQQLIWAIERSNAMKKQLNAYWHRHRIDPGKIEVVLDKEPEDEMPNMAEFLDLPPGPTVLDSGPPLLSSSLLAASVSADPPMDQQANGDCIHGHLNWNNILSNPSLSHATASPASPIPSPGHAKAFMDWNSWGQLSEMLRQRWMNMS